MRLAVQKAIRMVDVANPIFETSRSKGREDMESIGLQEQGTRSMDKRYMRLCDW